MVILDILNGKREVSVLQIRDSGERGKLIWA